MTVATSPATVPSANLVDAETPPPSVKEEQTSHDEQRELTEAEQDLFTLLDLHPNNADDQEKLERDKNVIWGKVDMLLKYVQQPFRRKYKFCCWKREVYPLGMMCALRAPQELIRKAHALFPVAGIDALYVAVSYNSEMDTLKWLLEEIPDAAKCPDSRGRIALHHVIQCTCLEQVKIVYDAFPGGVNVKDSEKQQTPLHWAFEFSSVPMIKLLIGKVDDSALLDEDCDNDTPLHLALLNKDYKVAKYVVKQYPDFVRKSRDSDGWFPLHFACAYGVSLQIVKLLIEHYPEAVQQKDANGKLPLALACKNKEDFSEAEHLELLDLLVGAYPASISAVDNKEEAALDEETKNALMKYMASQLQEHRSKRQKTCNK